MAPSRTREIRNYSRLTIRQRNAMAGYMFIFPWILGFLLFTAYPFFYSIYLSFSNVKITTQGIVTDWVGFRNYYEVLHDANFTTMLLDDIIFIVLSTPLIVVISLILALLLNENFKGRGLFRAIYFLPVIIISGPVISELVTNRAMIIVNPEKYIVYKFISTLPSIVSMPVLYVFDNLVMILWFSGVQILIFLAGLQKIDNSIYEAAKIDGASSWQVLWKIVLPFLRPMALINAIYTIVEVSSFPTNKVNTEISSKLFETGIVFRHSTAMAWSYFLVILLLLGLSFLILREKSSGR